MWLFVLPLSIFIIQRIKGVSYNIVHLVVCIIVFMHISIHIICGYDDLKCT